MGTTLRMKEGVAGLLLLIILYAGTTNATHSSDVLDAEPYLVVYPNSLIPGMPLGVRVTLLRASAPVNVLVELWNNVTLVTSHSTTMVAGETSHVQLLIPVGLRYNGTEGYSVEVSGSGGLTFSTSGYIRFERDHLEILTQTDKARYTGGQDVRFRSVILLPNMIGYKGNATVTVYDGQANKIRVIGPIFTNNGVVEGKIRLSKEPVFGKWSLSTYAQGVTASKQFTVKPYTLPKFSVSISKLGENDTIIEVKVTARYTFSSEVHGLCQIELSQSSSDSRALRYRKEIQGTVVFQIRKADVTDSYGKSHSALNIQAQVTDATSSITMVAEKANFVHSTYSYSTYSRDAKIERFDNRLTFVPGMNFYTTFSVEGEDEIKGKPSKISVDVKLTTVEVRPCMLAHPPYLFLQQFTTTLPQFYVDADASGLAALNIPTPPNAESLNIKVKSEFSGYTSKSFTIYPLVMEDTPMLRIVPYIPYAKIGENINLFINASDEMTGKLIIEVYARGMVMSVTSMDVASTKVANISVVATADMVPHTHIVVSHITRNNSFMYDYAIVKVLGSPLKNKVAVEYNITTLQPGADVAMTLTSDPNSTVYVLAEDLKNRLLGTDNDIFLYELEDEIDLAGYDASSGGQSRPYPYNYFSRSVHVPDADTPSHLPNNFTVTGYSFIDDGLVVLPENANILNRVTYSGYRQAYRNYSYECVNPLYRTTRISYYPNSGGSGGMFPSGNYHPNIIPTPAPGMTYAPGQYPTYVPGLVPAPGSVPVRGYFPETWIWEQFQIGPSGKLSVPVTVPDSITTWITTAFSINENTGFGLGTSTPNITVKKDFFMVMSPPSVVVLGEEFLLQMTVYNYLDTAQKVLVQVNTSDENGSVLESTFDVASGEGHSTYFQMTPHSIGPMSISAVARAGFFANTAVDAIIKHVTVKPNGVHRQMNEQHLVELTSGATFNKTFSLSDPPNMVPGSKFIQMSVTGDFMAASVNGLERLISMPYGCGEQNMLNFAPDVYVTKYLQSVGKLTDDVRIKALTFMEAGYQRQMTYKHRDGSFSVFGEKDYSGSAWLTAFVLKCFHQANGLLEIDESITARGINWLLRYQNTNGSFYEPGRVFDTAMQAGTGSGLKLTAFILISLLENVGLDKNTTMYNATVNATSYLEQHLHEVNDVYTFAIVCHALTKAGNSNCFSRLETLAIHDRGLNADKMSWNAGTRLDGKTPLAAGRNTATTGRAADIEATSYCLLTYLEVGERQKAKAIVKWLVSQRNALGGFRSTQDTIIALQALSLYASQGRQGMTQVQMTAAGGAFNHAYTVTQGNADVVHTVEVPTSLKDLQVTATGKGSVVVDVTTSYYVAGIQNSSHIAMEATIDRESLNSISVSTCVQWKGPEPSGMIVAEVEMPTGFSYDERELARQGGVKRYEMHGQFLALYFDGMSPSRVVCPLIKMDRTDPVVKSQPCHITVYDYYEPSHQARTRYEAGVLKRATICDVCKDCDFCKAGTGIGQIGVGK